MTLEIEILAWEIHKNVMGLNRLMGSQQSVLDNWISNDNTYINKRYKICTYPLPPKTTCMYSKANGFIRQHDPKLSNIKNTKLLQNLIGKP